MNTKDPQRTFAVELIATNPNPLTRSEYDVALARLDELRQAARAASEARNQNLTRVTQQASNLAHEAVWAFEREIGKRGIVGHNAYAHYPAPKTWVQTFEDAILMCAKIAHQTR